MYSNLIKSVFTMLLITMLTQFAQAQQKNQTNTIADKYDSDYGNINFHVTEQNIAGEYYYKIEGVEMVGGIQECKLQNFVLTFKWLESNGNKGSAVFTFSSDYKSFTGIRKQTNSIQTEIKWDGTKIE